jgi:hypothetical protein
MLYEHDAQLAHDKLREIGLTPEQATAAEKYFSALPSHIRVAMAGMSALAVVASYMNTTGMTEREAKQLLVALMSAMFPDDKLLLAAEFHNDVLEKLLRPTKT